MNATWRIQLIKPKQTIDRFVFNAWRAMMPKLQVWMEKKLVPAMVFGGLGIEGIAQTDFYHFITSVDGLSQLGIDASQPPKLLKAYETTAFKVKKTRRMIILSFGNVAKLKAATPHPDSGTQGLTISSWLEWILDGKTEPLGFVPRSRLPQSTQDEIRLGAPLGGLMLGRGIFGSSGLWKFPVAFQGYEDKWLAKNVHKIQSAIFLQATEIFKKELIK